MRSSQRETTTGGGGIGGSAGRSCARGGMYDVRVPDGEPQAAVGCTIELDRIAELIMVRETGEPTPADAVWVCAVGETMEGDTMRLVCELQAAGVNLKAVCCAPLPSPSPPPRAMSRGRTD